MTREEIKNGIYDYLCDADDTRLASLCKDYHDTTGEGCDFEEMSDFDDNMEGSYSPTDIANMATNGSWNDCDSYYQCDGSSIETFDDLSDYFDLEEMADYCVENDDDLGDCRIKDLLDKLSENDFIITLRYSEDSSEEFTMDELKDSTTDRGDYYICKDWAEDADKILTLGQWICELDQLTKDDGVEEVNLIKLDFEQLLCEKCASELTVVGYEGRVFGKGYTDGRPFRWFYNVEHKILLKLVYDSDKFEDGPDTYRYIVEVLGMNVLDVYRLIMEN